MPNVMASTRPAVVHDKIISLKNKTDDQQIDLSLSM